MTIETLTHSELSVENKENLIPDHLEFGIDYGKPVDFFEKYRQEITEIHDNIEGGDTISVKRKDMLDAMIKDYFQDYAENNKPVFLNSIIHQKECVVPFFRSLIGRLLMKKGYTSFQVRDVTNLFGEAFGNLIKHEDKSAYVVTDKIPFKLLIDLEKLQFLLGDSDIPESGKIDNSQIHAIDWSDPEQLAKAEFGGMGLSLLVDEKWSKAAEIRKRRVDFPGQSSRDEYAYLVTFDLLKELPNE